MKKVILFLGALLVAGASQSATLVCSNADSSFKVKAHVGRNGMLKKLDFSSTDGESESYSGLSPDQNYNPWVKKYEGMNRYSLEHGTLWLPSDLSNRGIGSEFGGRAKSNMTYTEVRLVCTVK